MSIQKSVQAARATPGAAPARRTQVERSASSRAALIGAARRLFASEGYAALGTERLASAAGLSRGALYHQFADKLDLFASVLDDVEREIAERMTAAVASLDSDRTADLLVAGTEAFLDACDDPAIQRIVLIDGPSVLGWARWREICFRHTVGLVAALLADGMERGSIVRQPVDPLTHILIGAADEAALYVAQADDPATARTNVMGVVRQFADAISRKA